jgi:hypothetical protein
MFNGYDVRGYIHVMTRNDLIRRGQRNIEDALFLRERIIPVAIEGKRWNILLTRT